MLAAYYQICSMLCWFLFELFYNADKIKGQI